MKYRTSQRATLGWLWMIVAALGLWPAQVASATIQLFSMETRANTCNLAEIDWMTGAVTHQFPTESGPFVNDLVYDPSADQLFGFGHDDDFVGGLYSINRFTGELAVIGQNDLVISAMAIHPTTFELYAMSFEGALYTLDKTTGAATVIGTDPDFVFAHGLAFHPNGTLYASDTFGAGTSGLFIVDPTNGSAVQTATINRNFVVSLDFHPNGTLYGSDHGTDTLITINIATGFASTVGPYGNFLGHNGIAFVVPSPSAGVVLILGAAIPRRRRSSSPQPRPPT